MMGICARVRVEDSVWMAVQVPYSSKELLKFAVPGPHRKYLGKGVWIIKESWWPVFTDQVPVLSPWVRNATFGRQVVELLKENEDKKVKYGDGEGHRAWRDRKDSSSPPVREPTKDPDPFSILFLLPGAPLEVAKAAYRALALLYHPDKRPDGATRMQEINEAWRVVEPQCKSGVK